MHMDWMAFLPSVLSDVCVHRQVDFKIFNADPGAQIYPGRPSVRRDIQHLGRQAASCCLELLQSAQDRVLVLFVLGSAPQSPSCCFWVGMLNPNRTPPLG